MSNERIIWDYLYDKIRNVYGVAGLMGNLYAESSLNPKSANGVKKLGLTNETYTQIVDRNLNDNFVTDGIAYGIAQWCYKTRKKGLLELARLTSLSIGDINLQLEYLWQELQGYKTVLNTLYSAKNVKEASDMVMIKYERPANKSEKMKQKRADYGTKYLLKYGQEKVTITINKDIAELLKKQIERKTL